MRTRIVATAAAGLLVAAAGACAQAPEAAVQPQPQSQQGPAATLSTEQFVTEAAVADMSAIDAGKIALKKSQDPRIREPAQHLVDDHTKIAADLEAALAKSGSSIDVPKELDPARRGDLDNLKAVTPTAFDREYVRSQIRVQDDAVTLFSSYARDGDNPALKQFAEQTLPTLEAHQKMVHRIAGWIDA
jgi:putative membrane protein